jgi:hypothetical protein
VNEEQGSCAVFLSRLHGELSLTILEELMTGRLSSNGLILEEKLEQQCCNKHGVSV